MFDNKCNECICNRCINNVNSNDMEDMIIECFNCDSCYYYCYNFNFEKNDKNSCEDYCTNAPRFIVLK